MLAEYPRIWVRKLIQSGLENIPESFLRKLAGPAIVQDGVELDIITQVILRFLEPLPKINQLQVGQNQSMDYLDQYAQTVPESFFKMEDRVIPGGAGELAIRIYTPHPASGPRPLLIYFHGGNSVAGDLDTHNPICCTLARQSDCLVIAVHYRRLPEFKFPAAQEDANRTFEWARENAGELGVDPHRIAVGGEGSGGGLAAAVALKFRQKEGDTENISPCFQLLLYPHLDMTRDNHSSRTYANGYMLTAEMLDYFNELYLNTEQEKTDVRISPALEQELRNLPPALIITAGFDPVRDEAQAYGEALEQAGNSVTYICYETMVHYFINLTVLFKEGRQALEAAGAELSKIFRTKKNEASGHE